ncbi:MAG: ATP-binding protein, partial [Burkholderiaceae bacterium]
GRSQHAATPMPAEAGIDNSELRLAWLERELAQAHLAMEDFTYSVSHDLRASLRHVSAFVRIAREDLGAAADPDVVAHLDKAAGAASQMGRLMDGLLELSRIDRAELQLGNVDLERLVDDIRHQLQQQAPAHDIVWQVAPDVPQVYGDVALLHQMLAQLLGNAIKFTRNSAQARITIDGHQRDDGWVEIQLRDNGVGFDPRLKDRLFRVFQSLHSAREFDGIGIGLALARRVVERHGGTIAASGEPGKGCCISLSLPPARP